MSTPSIPALRALCASLRETGIVFALGGSGLLWRLGYPTDVHDWDLTTEAPRELVQRAIGQFHYEIVPPNGPFATEYLAKVVIDEARFDLMGKFAVHTPSEIRSFPTRISGYWDDIPLGCPEIWADAYREMARSEKYQWLVSYLKTSRSL